MTESKRLTIAVAFMAISIGGYLVFYMINLTEPLQSHRIALTTRAGNDLTAEAGDILIGAALAIFPATWLILMGTFQILEGLRPSVRSFANVVSAILLLPAVGFAALLLIVSWLKMIPAKILLLGLVFLGIVSADFLLRVNRQHSMSHK